MSEQPSDATVSNERKPGEPTVQDLLLKEQRRTNELLEMLIQALADEGAVEADVESIIPRDLAGRPLKARSGGGHA